MIARDMPGVARHLPSLIRAAREISHAMTDAERDLERETGRLRRALAEKALCNRMIRICPRRMRQHWVDRLGRAVLGAQDCWGAVAQARRAVEMERVKARGGNVG